MTKEKVKETIANQLDRLQNLDERYKQIKDNYPNDPDTAKEMVVIEVMKILGLS